MVPVGLVEIAPVHGGERRLPRVDHVGARRHAPAPDAREVSPGARELSGALCDLAVGGLVGETELDPLVGGLEELEALVRRDGALAEEVEEVAGDGPEGVVGTVARLEDLGPDRGEVGAREGHERGADGLGVRLREGGGADDGPGGVAGDGTVGVVLDRDALPTPRAENRKVGLLLRGEPGLRGRRRDG